MPRSGGRTATYKRPQFSDIPKVLLEFARSHDFQAQVRRRDNVANATGFTLKDAREHLYRTISGLNEFGMSDKSVHRLMVAPHKGRRAAANHHAVVDCKLTLLRNDDREYTDLVHLGAAPKS